MKFILPIQPPTSTSQERRFNIHQGKIHTYLPAAVKQAKQLYMEALQEHVPDEPLDGPLYLGIEFVFAATKSHPAGTWSAVKPDLDNSIKLLQDCLAHSGYFTNDSRVCKLHAQKKYAKTPHIKIELKQLNN